MRKTITRRTKMPIFYFDIHRDKSRSPDTEGTEYKGVLEARIDAIKMLAAIVQDQCHCELPSNLSVFVRDESHRPVMEAKITCDVQFFDNARSPLDLVAN